MATGVYTEAEGNRELAQHGILPRLAGEECPSRSDLYCDGQSVPSAVFPALVGAAQLQVFFAILAAAAAGIYY
jgi:hypothetical protein